MSFWTPKTLFHWQRPRSLALANSAHSGIQNGARSILAEQRNRTRRIGVVDVVRLAKGSSGKSAGEFTTYLLDTVYSVIIECIQ
jgi:hypothetical protein